MTTAEHLDRILARCRELLALAEKRTPGKWEPSFHDRHTLRIYASQAILVAELPAQRTADYTDDSRYIAACAGTAEAGWRATIAAIEHFRDIQEHEFASCDKALAAILVAWPKEVL